MLKLQYFGHLMQRADSLEKILMLGKIEGRKRSGWQDGWHHWLNGQEFGQTARDLKDREAWRAAVHRSQRFRHDLGLQFSLVAQSCPTLCDPMNHSMPGLPVHHQFPEFTQTQVHKVGESIQPSHPLSSPSPPAFNLSQHQGLFQWVSSSHQVAKVLELQHQSFQ